MNAYQNTYNRFAGMTMDEYGFLHHASAGLTANQMQIFTLVYNNRRKNPQDILLVTLLGFVGFAGLQRFITGQVLLGVLYFFTGGFLLIGTIIDLINYQSIANDYNRHLAYECYNIAKMNN